MITGVVLARNEAKHIVACLASLRPHVGELILIDMESSDETVALARPFISKVLTATKTPNFDAARNLAIGEASFEWLWYLDADEMIRQHGRDLSAIWIPFKTHFCGKWIEHSGWWPGYTMPRVLKRGKFHFPDRLHGGVEVDGQHFLCTARSQAWDRTLQLRFGRALPRKIQPLHLNRGQAISTAERQPRLGNGPA